MVYFSNTISKLKVKLCIHVQGMATSQLCFLLPCYCRYFDETFTAMLLVFLFYIIWLYLANSQVIVYRTIGPLVLRL